MRIGIDIRLLERRMSGVGRYVFDLVKELPLLDKENDYTIFSYRPVSGFGASNMRNVSTLNMAGQGKFQKLISPLWMNFILPRFLKREKIDIFLSPNNLLPLRETGTKNIVSIMDVFPIIDPNFHSALYRAYAVPSLRSSAKRADHIMTISEHSKRDIVKYLHVPEKRVTVTYLSAAKRFMPRDLSLEERARLQEKYQLPENFILYIGVIEKRKNIEGIIRIADMLNQPSDLPIVLVGRPGFGGEEFLRVIQARKNMHYCGFVADEDIPLFYNLATAFLFPSWYEGFGFPALEAMQSGLPVVASNTSSLPEVVGSAGVMLDPTDYEGFVQSLREVCTNTAKHNAMRAAGIAQATHFTPEKTARGTLEAFRIASRA